MGDSMNEIEFNKNFENFCEVFELIAFLEASLNIWESEINAYEWELHADRLKFCCLKFNLFEADELENIDITNWGQLKNFCEDLKTNISDNLIMSIKN